MGELSASTSHLVDLANLKFPLQLLKLSKLHISYFKLYFVQNCWFSNAFFQINLL